MRLVCDHCGRSLEFVGPRPSFCGYCGKPIASTPLTETADYQPQSTSTLDGASPGLIEEAPAQIGDYKVIRPLGGGGMGVVYEAESSSGQRVAIKLMRPEVRHSSASEERFRQEGRLASGIAHPRCVFVHGVDQEADRPYIVMELMTGETLKDLVQRDGPLAPLDAVAKIIDVIDGLREAHALGVIHRDVKPSNCFLEGDGRVKVGDFGLSRSLTTPSHLTQTGGFLGTVLFASPEQHKGEGVDVRTDVYSVCATLFYLLTGKAPFEDSKGTAAIARIVSEPAPTVRKFRPDVPRAIERIVRIGLERSPERRFQSLDELQIELAALVPGRLTFAGAAARVAAYLFDSLILHVAVVALTISAGSIASQRVAEFLEHSFEFIRVATIIVYFWCLEANWGASLGKRMLRLRVSAAAGLHAPSWRQILLRSLLFCVIHEGLPDFATMRGIPGLSELAVALVYLALQVVCMLILMSTMRSRNGYRMLHDVLSGTQVVQLPWPTPWLKLKWPRLEDRSLSPPPEGVPKSLGRFTIRGTMRRDEAGLFLLGEDVELGRQSIVWMREAPALSDERRRLVRATRLRWLEGGRHHELLWDAFLAPRGSSLPQVVSASGKLDWQPTRLMLEQLAEELEAGLSDGSLPDRLALDELWMQEGGGLQVLDWPLDSAARLPQASRGASLLRESAILALEGKTRSPNESQLPICAVLPLHARSLVNRLIGAKESFLHRMFVGKKSYETVAEVQADLAATKNLPARVGLSLRVLQVGLMTVGLGALLVVMTVASRSATNWEILRLQRIVEGRIWQRSFAAEGLRTEALSALPVDHPMRADPRLLDALVEREVDRSNERLAIRRAGLGPVGNVFLQLCGLMTGAEAISNVDADRVLQAPTSESPYLSFGLRRPEGGSELVWFKVNADDLSLSDPRDADIVRMLRYTAFGFWLVWLVWGVAFRGGVSYRLAGVALVRWNGRPAWRLQVLWRAILFWLPVAVPIMAVGWIDAFHPELSWLCEALHWLTLIILSAYSLALFRSPARHWHDRLSGVYLVPR